MRRKAVALIDAITDNAWFWLTVFLYGIAYLVWCVMAVGIAFYHWIT